MKQYQITLAQLAWIKGTVYGIGAESWEEAFAIAKKHNGDSAEWPIDEDGDEVRGFGDIEIYRAYCAEETETDHDGEPPAADVLVYKAAPALAAALKALVDTITLTSSGHCQVESRDIGARHAAAVEALRAAGLEVDAQ